MTDRARYYWITLILVFTVAIACGIWIRVTTHASVKDPENGTTLDSRRAIGRPAPSFQLRSYNGASHSLRDYQGRSLLLHFFCGCTPCKKLASVCQEVYRKPGRIAVVGISSLSTRHTEEYQRTTQVSFPLLFDPGYGVAKRFDSLHCPRWWHIDKKGMILSFSQPDAPIETTIRELRRSIAADASSS